MSLDTVELIVALESFFELSIPDIEIEKMGTVQGIADGLCRLRGGCDSVTPSRIRHGCHANIQRILQAMLRLPRRPDLSIPLVELQPTTVVQWQPFLGSVYNQSHVSAAIKQQVAK